MASDIIPNDVAARILHMSKRWMFDEMLAKRMDIGYIKPRDRKKMSGRSTFLVYRTKLAAHLGRPADYVWPEEKEG